MRNYQFLKNNSTPWSQLIKEGNRITVRWCILFGFSLRCSFLVFQVVKYTQVLKWCWWRWRRRRRWWWWWWWSVTFDSDKYKMRKTDIFLHTFLLTGTLVIKEKYKMKCKYQLEMHLPYISNSLIIFNIFLVGNEFVWMLIKRITENKVV